jgi:hypothetical protein
MRFAALSSLSFVAILGFGCSAASTNNQFEGAGGQGSDSVGTLVTSGNGSNGAGGGFTSGSGAGAGGPNCSEEAKLIYVLDSNNGLHSFDPPSKMFKPVGTMNCSATMQPNSMAVDRNAVAWADYVASDGLGTDTAGSLFQVSTQNASCQPTPSVNLPSGWFRIGMGYSADTAGGTAETLYIAGVPGLLGGGSSGLGRVDPSTLSVVPIGQFTGGLAGQSAELTGTGDGRLYGFFTTTPVHVARIDKATGAIDPNEDWPLPTVEVPQAWAFSFWGGDFYLYTSPGVGDPFRTSNVTRFRPSDMSVDTAYMVNVGFHIVGAGVSTCAPLVPPTPN